MDLDNRAGLWIKGEPYLWMEGSSSRDCKRFYLVGRKFAALFDKNLKVLNKEEAEMALVRKTLKPEDTLCLLPIPQKGECGVARNYFLAWIMRPISESMSPVYKNLELRIEGRRVRGSSKNPDRLRNGRIEIESPGYSYQFSVYPYAFTLKSPADTKAEIRYEKSGRTERYFNLFSAASHRRIDRKHIKSVHAEALLNRLVEIEKLLSRGDKEGEDLKIESEFISEELERLGEKSPRRTPQLGWRYEKIADMQALIGIYEILIGKAKQYTGFGASR